MGTPTDEVEAYLASIDMTVEEARCIRANPFACACAGPPEELLDIQGAPCRCMLTCMKVDRLLGVCSG